MTLRQIRGLRRHLKGDGIMARKKRIAVIEERKEALSQDEGLHGAIRSYLQEVLESEIGEALGAGKSERSENRQGNREGYFGRTLITQVGKLELRMPQDRHERFSTEISGRYQRSEKALVSWLNELCVQGVSTRKVKAITKKLCGHDSSASTISRINAKLDGLPRESPGAGLHGVEFVVSDDHAGLHKAVMEIVPEAACRRCDVHFLRNALDHLPRKAGDDCLKKLHWLNDKR